MNNLITNTLQADPVSLHIVRFLLKNRQAMDSAKGIAAWWVGCDEIAAQTALDRLTGCGVLSAYTFKSCTLYGLSQDEGVRGWLESWFAGQYGGNGNGPSLTHRSAQPSPGSLTVLQTAEQANQDDSAEPVNNFETLTVGI